MPDTRERWRSRLPHWEVRDHAHFVTLRCANSLPKSAQLRIKEIHDRLSKIEPHDPDFAQWQRQYFLTCEKPLDHPSADSFAPFRDPTVAELVLADLKTLKARDQWSVQTAVIMPNHVHFILSPPTGNEPKPLREVIRTFKGRTARQANLLLERKGSFWQRDWFDRWMRNERELERTAAYIHNNPVKAGLVKNADDWRWRI